MANMFARWKFQIALIAMIAVFAVLPGASRDEPVAYAHHGENRDYVDVGLTLEVPEDDASAGAHKVHVIVVNHGTRTAYDVVVDVSVETLKPLGQTGTLTQSFFSLDLRGGTEAPVGHISVGETGDGKSTFRWTIPRLHGLQREVVIPVVDHATNDNEGKVHKISGTVTTTSFQSDIHKENDDFEVWTYAQNTRNTEFIQVGVNYSVSVSVDNRLPARGDTVNFTITAGRRHTHPDDVDPEPDVPPPIDLKVDIGLTNGLTAGTPSRYYTTNSSDVQTIVSSPDWAYSMGRLDIGTGVAGQKEVIAHSMILPVTVGSGTDVVVGEQCLTATLIGNPPPGTGPLDDAIADNVATLCLGVPDGKVVFSDGTADLWALYPCVGVTTSPCDATDSVILAVNRPSTGADAGTPVVFDPEKVVVHVPDRLGKGRYIYGGNISWNNGHDADHSRWGAGILPGLVAKFDRSVVASDNYSKLRASLVATTPGEGNDKGHVSVVYASSFGLKIFDTAGATPRLSDGPVDYSTEVPLFFRFTKLGTYTLEITMGALYDANPSDSTPPSDPADLYSDTATYTFHVGPMADLEVRDGGGSSHVAADQHALTIVAVNNGPDQVPGAQVTGLPIGAEVIHVSRGTYNSASGEWDIGELRPRGYYSSRGEPEPTLVLSAAAADTANVSIANTENYKVCIGSGGSTLPHTTEAACVADTTNGGSWHEGTVYDYNADNNTVAIAAHAGASEPHPSAPKGLSVMETPLLNIVQWSPVDNVNDLEVTHYQVERWTGRWTPLADGVPWTWYLDLEGRPNADYRVRALNAAGVPGLWSITGRPPDAPGNFTVALSDSGNGAVLSWTAPASPTPVTGYVIDISDSAEGDSRTNDATVGANVTTWTHTGLSGGDVKFYRVQARNRDGVGPWTEWQSVSTGPGAPGSLRARANGPSEIVLTWSEASSRDVTIYEYELEYSDTSASQGYEWTFLNTVIHDEGLRYVDNTVPHGTTRYYRVRGRTLQGNVGGAWSNVASATTSAAGPSPPLNVSADFAVGNTENGILLTWDAPASGDASYYRIEHSTDGVTWESESARHTGTCDVGGQTKFCYTDSGLFSGTEHWYRVAGVNSSGVPGEWSAPVSHITQGEPTDAPGEPQNLRITSVSGRQVTLAWEAPADDGGTRVTGYEYMVEGPCVHAPEEICQVVKPTRTGGTTRTVTVPNFRGHYGFYVRALNAVGAGPYAQPVGQYINPQRNWRVTLSPSRLTVTEGGEATYRVKLTSDPGQPVWVALDWSGDESLGEGHPDRGIPSLSEQQFKWLLPSNYASRNPDIYLDPDYTAPWNTGVTITVTAREDGDSENGTAEIRHDVFYIPCAELGNPAGCVDDPEDTGVNAYLTVTEEDND